MRSLVAIIGLFAVTAAAACGSNSGLENGGLRCTSACPDGYVCGTDNRCWPVGTPDVGGTSAGGSGGLGGGGDAAVPDGPSAEPDVPVAVSVGGAGGIIAAGGNVVDATVFIGGTGGTTGWLGGAMSTGGGITTGGTGGVGRGIDAGVAGAGSGGTGGVGGSVGPNCGLTTANLIRQPADLLLVLDKTGSMTSSIDSTTDCLTPAAYPDAGQSCQQRWTTMVSGLDVVLSGASGEVNWGLQLFNSDGACGVAAAPEVPIGPGSAAAIQAIIAAVTPNGSTPTRTAVNAAVTYLQTLTDTNGKYILLATDGEPNCLATAGGGGSGTSDVAGTVAAITVAAAAGIKVYVVGVGPETGNLDNFAVAGGTGHYYPVLSPQDLNAALATIVGTVASCTFSLGKAPPDPRNVVIQFNGDKGLRAPHDTTHANGWDYTSSTDTTVQLYGSWCDKVTNGTYTSAEVLMGCQGSPIH